VDAQVFTNTETSAIQGWSYAVKHNGDVLSIVEDSVTTVGTIAHPETEGAVAFPPNFDVSQAVPGGLISAIVLSFLTETELPVGSRSAILNVSYTVNANPGADGTALEFVGGEIGPKGSPPTDINFTVDGASRLPATVIDGVIKVAGPPPPPECDAPDWAFYFGAVVDGELEIDGSSPAPIVARNATDAFAFQMGVSYVDGVHSFSSELGADPERLIELIITDGDGNSQSPATPNTLRSPAATGIARGAAISGFDPGDFFAVDLEPGVGGPGFTVGYVSDLDGDENKIPATVDNGAECGSNEILIVSFSDDPPPPSNNFIRGDADGNERLNVTDAVLIINVTLGNLPARFACDDALDANDDGSANISDAIPVLMFMFQRGADLPAPHGVCGQDTTADDLPCTEDSPACAG
ncbi:MAG: hypothetical protein AAF517_05525, partial [Planctomycetota bacterium]